MIVRWIESHLFRLSMIAVGLSLAPIFARIIDRTWLGGTMAPTFEKINTYAWANLCMTTAIPLLALCAWSYLVPFLPNIGRLWAHRVAHAWAIVASYFFNIFVLFWAHKSIWMSTDSGAAARFILAPFATLSVQVVLYMVVFWVVFRVGKL